MSTCRVIPMDDPRIENMMRYGHPTFRELLDEAIEANRYIEDIYGDAINPGDTYYENDCGELIHEDNLAQYALDRMELNEKTR